MFEIKWPERPEQIPAEVWEILPAFPLEYSGICGILPLPRIILDMLCPLMAPPGANFRLTNLVIAPSTVQIEQPVTISCTALNIGTEAGERTVECKLDGVKVAEQTITLNPNESVVVSFEVIPTVAKTYSVAVNGLSGSFRATTEPVADIRVENLRIEPTETQVGIPVSISVDVTNYGSQVGTRVVTCEVV